MRHRLTCPLYDQHPKHLELLNHLDQFAGGDRGRELATLAVAGFAALYGGGNSVPQSLEGDLGDLLRQVLQSGMAHQPAPVASPPATPAPEPAGSSTPPASKGQVKKAETAPKQETRPKPPQEPAPPAKSDLLDQAPSPEDEDDDEDHMDSLAMIGRKFG